MKNQVLLEVQPNSNPDQDSQTQNYFIDSADRKAESTRNVHFILQGKGGIGKSFVSTIIAQFVKQQDPHVLCLDTDPINATFSSFPSLGVRSIVLLEENNMINERRFDDMMEQILEADSNVVVDNGATSYVPMSSYLIENEAFNTIQDAGKQVIVHSVIAGGLAQDNTVSDFVTLTSQLPVGVQVVVWLNEHLGPIESEGKFFEEMRAYLDNKHRVTGIVRLPKRTDNTYGKDIATMLKRRLTFDEALKSDTFQLMSKQRIKIVQRSIYEQLAIVI